MKEVDRGAGIYKYKAGGLLEKLLTVPELSWNSLGEIAIYGKPVKGSNIVTLVVDAAKPHRKTSIPPTGWIEFGNLLNRNNISEVFIGNAERYVDFFRDKTTFDAGELATTGGPPTMPRSKRRKQVDFSDAAEAAAHMQDAAALVSKAIKERPPPAKKPDKTPNPWFFD
jgi:hypothetical protein